MGLVHGLLPVVQLFVQVTLLFTEQILEHREVRGLIFCTNVINMPPETEDSLLIYFTFSVSMSNIFCCRDAFVTSMDSSH